MITYQQEFLESVRDDAQPLLEAHWQEIALNKDIVPLDPDWDAYEQLEEEGKLFIFTARDGGQLAGYFVVIVAPHIHYKSTLFGTMI